MATQLGFMDKLARTCRVEQAKACEAEGDLVEAAYQYSDIAFDDARAGFRGRMFSKAIDMAKRANMTPEDAAFVRFASRRQVRRFEKALEYQVLDANDGTWIGEFLDSN